MSDGVKETLCTSCEHRKVCMYKLDYLLVVKGLQKDCSFYQSVAKGIWE